MKLFARVLAPGIALSLVAAACGGSTGEGPTTTQPTAAPPAETQAAAPAEPVALKHLILYGDTVRGNAGLTDEEKKSAEPQGLTCVQMSRFPQGSRIVWRVRVVDPLSGDALDDKALQSVDLLLPDGSTVVLKYGPHGGTKENPTDFFWVAGWTVPSEYPTGVFNFNVVAKSLEGAVGSWGYDAFKVTAGQLQIIPGDLGTRRF